MKQHFLIAHQAGQTELAQRIADAIREKQAELAQAAEPTTLGQAVERGGEQLAAFGLSPELRALYAASQPGTLPERVASRTQEELNRGKVLGSQATQGTFGPMQGEPVTPEPPQQHTDLWRQQQGLYERELEKEQGFQGRLAKEHPIGYWGTQYAPLGLSLAKLGLRGLRGLAQRGMVSAAEKGRAALSAADEALLAEERGRLGGVVQRGSRTTENIQRLETKMTPEQRAQMATMEQPGGEIPQLQQRVAQSELEALPGQAADIAEKDITYANLNQVLPQTFEQRLGQSLSGRAAWQAAKPTLARYGPIAAGTAIGAITGGVPGAAAGWAIGGYNRPMFRAIYRMAQKAPIKYQFFKVMSSLTPEVGPTSYLPYSAGVAAARKPPWLQTEEGENAQSQ